MRRNTIRINYKLITRYKTTNLQIIVLQFLTVRLRQYIIEYRQYDLLLHNIINNTIMAWLYKLIVRQFRLVTVQTESLWAINYYMLHWKVVDWLLYVTGYFKTWFTWIKLNDFKWDKNCHEICNAINYLF